LGRYFEGYTNTTIFGVTASTYALGRQIGVPMKLTDMVEDNGGCAMLESVTLIDSALQSGKVILMFFKTEPTVTSADNGALTMTAAEAQKCIGVIDMGSSADVEKVSSAGQLFVTRRHLNMLLRAGKGLRDLWCILVAGDGSTYTANCLQLVIGVTKQ